MDVRRKKLLFQSEHCGIRENDFLLGQFAERRLASLSDEQLDRYELLLKESDNDIYDWITGRVPVPERLDHDVMAALISFAKEF